jgi:lactoylglutathione lyase
MGCTLGASASAVADEKPSRLESAQLTRSGLGEAATSESVATHAGERIQTDKEQVMSATKTHIRGLRTVSVPVDDQDTALAFYVDTLGFTKLRDDPTPGGGRWIELVPGDESVSITLEPAAPGTSRGAIGIRFSTHDTEAAHGALRDAGVDTDEILRWPGVPPMFAFRDPDGNAFSITELA